MSRVVVLFGEMGAGKSHAGRLLAQRLGLTFVEGDDHLHPEFLALAGRFGMPSRALLDRSIDHLIGRVLEIAGLGTDFVLAQAMYRDYDRRRLARALVEAGHRVQFVWVRVGFWRNLRQLLSRERGWRWAWYWLRNRPWFDAPTHPTARMEDL